MNFNYLEKLFPLEKFLADQDPNYKWYADNIALTCPQCGKEEKLYVQMRAQGGAPKGSWVCYSCGEGGYSLFGLIYRFTDNKYEVRKVLENYCQDNPQALSLTVRDMVLGSLQALDQEVGYDREPLEVLPVPREYQELTEPTSYLQHYKITEIECRKYELGLCTEGFYRDRIIVPMYLNSQYIFFLARLPTAPKYNQIPLDVLRSGYNSILDYLRTEKPLPQEGKPSPIKIRKVIYPKGSRTSQILYGYDQAKSYKTIILVEDWLSKIKLGDDCVSILGTKLSPEQLELLLKSQATEIVLLLDRNATVRPHKRCPEMTSPMGKVMRCTDCKRVEDTYKLARGLQSYFRVKIVELPNGRDPKDLPGWFLRELISRTRFLEEREDLSEFQELRNRIAAL